MSFLTGAVRLGLALLVLSALTACDAAPPGGSIGEGRGVLTFGLLPDEDPKLQRARYAPLLEAVRSRTGLEVEMITPSSYSELVDLFGAGTVDVAYFGGYTYLLAHARHDAQPVAMRDIDARFVSHVIVHRDNTDLRELADLRGMRFSFGSVKSTSGHLMPRYYFSKAGIDAESYFSELVYSGAHDRTVQLVVDGTVDAGVANGQIVQALLKRGDEAPPVRILWQSPPYVDYVWAVQSTMSDKTRRAITQVFLALSRDDEREAAFLDAIGARHFLPAATSDFDILRTAIDTVLGPENLSLAQ